MAKYDLSEERLELLIKRFPKFKKQIIDRKEKVLEELNSHGQLLNKEESKIVFNFLPTVMALDLELVETTTKEQNSVKDELKLVHRRIIGVLKEFADLKEEHYNLISTWIVGSYLHGEFNSYPYLFLNAMRGSGKTRLLKLIASMSANGEIIGSPTEAILFRIPTSHTLCIDEYEGIMRKGNEGVREMLNASYKRGMKVRRMKQQKTPDGSTEQVVEEFEPYRPICLANIWGMEEVLGDRCITIILEKSEREDIMHIIENFEQNTNIKVIKSLLNTILVQLCSFIDVVGGIERWNKYVKYKYTTPHTLITLTTQTTQTTLTKAQIKEIGEDSVVLFERISKTKINGRNLELFFPLIILASYISEEVLTEVLQTATNLTKERRQEEMAESKDVSLYDFVSKLSLGSDFTSLRVLCNAFRTFLGKSDDNDDKWINDRWFGRAIKRLNIVIEKRRMKNGMEYVLDIEKAKKKMVMFR